MDEEGEKSADDLLATVDCFKSDVEKERLLIQQSLDEDSVMLEDPLLGGVEKSSSRDGARVGGRLTWAYGDEGSGDSSEQELKQEEQVSEVEASTSASTSNSYRDEWLRLFERQDYISVIKEQGLKNGLRSSRFRSVCWRVYLEVLPENQEQWVSSLHTDREKYATIKRKYVLDPQTGSQSREEDLTFNNPLSQDEESPWNRFFQDKECRQEISQDVRRTFPEIEFFQTTEMHDMMVNILFCYCKEHDNLGYKQGMHELLAPLIFILHCDQQAYLHAQEIKSQMKVVRELMDPIFLEHDSYMMFYRLMDTMEPWYRHGSREDPSMFRNTTFQSAQPFAKPFECSPSSPLIKKLTKIQEVVLKVHDSELHLHLTRLDIQPQIFGIRWIRLLFGREFTLQDLLVLWDTIFADSPTLHLIDYIFVAMLILVRELLLSGDYAQCMTLLMRFPMVGDVRCLVDKALHLRDPKKFPRPPNYQFQILQHSDAGLVIPSGARSPRRPQANGTVVQGGMMGASSTRGKKPSVMATGFNSLKRITNKSRQNDGDREQFTSPQSVSHPLAGPADGISEVRARPLKAKTSPGQETNMQAFSVEGATGQTRPTGLVTTGLGGSNSSISSSTSSIPAQQRKENLGGLFSKGRGTGKKSQQKDQESDLYNQVALLQGKMNDVQNMCRYCSTKMEAHLMQIQDEMVKLKLTQEDEMLLAVAGLKQVKDILNGTLKFAQGMEEQEDLIMTDDYYGREDDNSSSSADHKMDHSPLSEMDSEASRSQTGRTSDDMDLSSPDDRSGQSGSQYGGGEEGIPLPLEPLNTSQCNSKGDIAMTTEEVEEHFGTSISGRPVDSN